MISKTHGRTSDVVTNEKAVWSKPALDRLELGEARGGDGVGGDAGMIS